MKVELRPATENDYDFVRDVYFLTQRWIIETLFGWRGANVEYRKFDDGYQPEGASIIMADGADVGWLAVQRSAEIHLEGIYIVEDFQGRGIGTRLIGDLIAESERDRLPLTLSTAKVNPAQRLYARLGFICVGEDEYKLYMERRPDGVST